MAKAKRGKPETIWDEIAARPDEVLAAALKERCQRSLLTFFERAWREIDPAPLKVNWHHEAIAAHLEAVTRGEIRRLLINVPPRTSKTILVNVCYPAWTWTRPPKSPLSGPQVQFMCISYGQQLSAEIATLARRLITSEWYQGLWGETVKLLDDQGRIVNFGTTAGGVRIATSMGGSTLGRGGDIRIIDDPVSVEEANSRLETERVNRTYREALQTRQTDPETSAEIVIMQRLGEDDLTGEILKRERRSVVHLCLPMRHNSTRHCTTDWYDDPRFDDGELLWPEQFPKRVVDELEEDLGPYAFAGQMQQAPTPRGGGIFKREWLQPWPELSPDGTFPPGAVRLGRIQYPALEYVVAWVDTAFTRRDDRDASAITVWGVFRAEGKGRIERRGDGTYVRVADDYGHPKVLLLYGWIKRLEMHGPPEEMPPGVEAKTWAGPEYRALRQANWGLVEWVVDTCKRYKVDHLGIETQAAGHTLEQELRRLHSEGDWGVELVPAKGDKIARAYAVQHLVSAGQIYVPTFEDGTYPSWANPIIDQLCKFNPGSHEDDAVDTATGAWKHLRETGILERRDEFDRGEERAMSWAVNKPVPLPYDL